MAVAAGTLNRRQREESRAASKAKRDKIILAVGGAVLLVVFVVEVLPMLTGGGSSTPPAAPAPAVAPSGAAATAAAGVATAAVVRAELRAIAKLPSKDPFQTQVASTSPSSSGAPSLGHGPAVRAKRFVLKDPFRAQVGAAPQSAAAPLATPPHVTPAPTHHARPATATTSSSTGFIVILRSLGSQASADQEAKRAHAQGLTGAAVLYSSKYTTLRHGYWVVYLAEYPSMTAANAGLQQARTHGYASAYRRPIKK